MLEILSIVQLELWNEAASQGGPLVDMKWQHWTIWLRLRADYLSAN
jgi:hypothetical protein